MSLEPTSCGDLPPGIHRASYAELVARCGGTPWRDRLLAGLADACQLLAVAGCRRLWLGGSFVTTKRRPDDFDACWDLAGVDVSLLDPVLSDFADGRQAQKHRFSGELFPNNRELGSGLTFLEFFQRNRNGDPVGVVELSLDDIQRWDVP